MAARKNFLNLIPLVRMIANRRASASVITPPRIQIVSMFWRERRNVALVKIFWYLPSPTKSHVDTDAVMFGMSKKLIRNVLTTG